MQQAFALLIVLACAAHAGWALLPVAARHALARRLGRPLPAAAQGGCGACGGGCAPAGLGRSPVQPIVLHRRLAGGAPGQAGPTHGAAAAAGPR